MEVEVTIEVEGQANPMIEELVIKTLQGALSSSNQQLITAKQQLENWATQDGYYAKLESIFSNRRLPNDIRLQAIIQIKNGVDKQWRRSARIVVSNDDKERVRNGLLKTTIQEADTKLALLAALTLSKIARYDFPSQWPDAINDLMDAIRTFAGVEYHGHLPFQLRRSLLVLLHVVKEVVLNRVGPGRVRLKSTMTETLVLLGATYFNSFDLDMIRENLFNQDAWPHLEAALEQSLLAIKTMRRLTVGLMDRPHEDNTMVELWQRSLPVLQNVMSLVLSSSQDLAIDSTLFILIRKNLGQLSKLHVAMAKQNPTDFALLQPERYEVVRMHWQIVSLLGQKYATAARVPSVSSTVTVNHWDESRQVLVEKLGHQSLLLMRACIKMISMPGRGLRYRTTEEKEADEQSMSRLKEAMFSTPLIVELIHHLVKELFLLQPDDLKEWEDDPDEWERREELNSEDYEFSTRPCAEKLLLDLSLHFRETTLDQLLNLLGEVTSSNTGSILQKEAVYCAIGIAAPTVEKRLQFKQLLESNLISEVQIRSDEYRILRRRIAILVGQWSTVQDAQGIRPIYYQLFQFLLNKDDPINDQVVRVTAGRELGKAVDAWEYDAQEFLPFSDDLISKLMGLVEEVDLTETKINLLNTISIIVERMENLITPHAKRIVEMLPILWDQSADEHLMKQVILGLLTRLFRSMQAAGASYHGLILPLISATVTPNSPLGYTLLEDTLGLWCVIVQQTRSETDSAHVDPELLALAQYLPPLLQQDTENVVTMLEILEAYVILKPQVILSAEFFPQILDSIRPKLSTTEAAQSEYLTKAIEQCMNSALAVGGSSGLEHIILHLLNTGIFDIVIEGLKEAWEAHQTTGPKAIQTKVQGLVETDYLALLSRIAFSSPDLLLETLQRSRAALIPPERMKVPDSPQPLALTMSWLIEEWISHAEDTYDPGRRKLMTMALTRLLELQQPYMREKMQSLISLWNNLIVELTHGNDNPAVDSLVYTPAQLTEAISENISADEQRRAALNRIDPIHTSNLLDVVRNGLGSFIHRCGGEQRFQEEVMVNVDRDVVKQFLDLGIM